MRVTTREGSGRGRLRGTDLSAAGVAVGPTGGVPEVVGSGEEKVCEPSFLRPERGDQGHREILGLSDPGVVVACLLHTQEVPGSIPGRGSYLRQVS